MNTRPQEVSSTVPLKESLITLHCQLTAECQKLAATTLAMEPYTEHSETLTGHLLLLNDRLLSLAAMRDQFEVIIKGVRS